MKYLTDSITTKDFEEWINTKEDKLLIANAGAGKTYLLLEQFVTYLKPLKVLYCYNRKMMYKQFAKDYEAKHDNLTIMSYQKLEDKDLFSKDEQYLNEYDVILCDECQYFVSDSWNKKTYISFEKIQRNNAKKIYFTATPEPFEAIKHLISNDLKTLDMRNCTPKNVDSIYITKGETLFYKAEAYYLKQNKIIHFEDHKENNKKLAEKFNLQGYTTTSMHKDTDNEITEAIASSNNKQNIFIDYIATTSTNETGMNFNIEGNAMVTFPKHFNWTSIIQSAARLRRFNDNHISMLINTPHKNLLTNCLEKNSAKLKTLYKERENLLKEKDFFVSVLKYDFKIAMLEIENNEINKMLQCKDLAEYYKEKLQSIYPNATIQILDKYDLAPIEEVLNDLLGNDDQITLEKDKQQFVKNKLGLGISKIKEKMAEKFEVTIARPRINGIKETVWIIKRITQ